MKNYLPDYTKKKGEPSKESNADKVRATLPILEQEQIAAFVKECQTTIGSKGTLMTAQNSITLLFDVLEKPLSEFKREDINHFVGLVNNSGKTKAGRKHIFYMVKKFLAMHSKTKPLIELIKNKRETGNGSRIKKSDLITPDELEALLRAASNLRDKALLTMLYESAARPDELLGLKWKDITINDDEVAELSLFSGKKKETRNILVKDCVLHLQRWKREYSYSDLKPSDYVFIGKTREKPLTSAGLLKLVKSITHKAGIQKNIYPYLFRHTRLTFMRQKLKQPHYVQFAGHTERQSATYTHLDVEDLKEAILKEIYPTEELTPKQKEDYEKRIQALEKAFKQVLETTKAQVQEVNALVKDKLRVSN